MKQLRKLITRHWLLTLLVMFVVAAIFGLSLFNLFYLLHANIELISEHGYMALKDGALEQLLSLFFYGFISIITYIIFKACEKVMVETILK